MGQASVAWSPADGGTVYIQNWGITCPVSFWLMGDSESREMAKAIGQFGEGGPLGCLALVRAGHRVLMDNGPTRWEPTLAPSAKFGGKTVLTVRTRKLRKERPGFEVSITGVSREQYDTARGKFLVLRGYDPAQTVGYWSDRMEDVYRKGVLLADEHRNKVYVKGVLVQERDDLLFGYNLSIDELNRDRNSISESALESEVRDVLAAAVGRSEHVRESVAIMAIAPVEDAAPIEVRTDWGSLAWDEDLRKSIHKWFVKEHGEKAVPVSTLTEAREAEMLGLVPKRISTLGRIAVDRLGGGWDRRSTKAREKVRRTFTPQELPKAYANAATVIALAKFQGDDFLEDIQVVEFQGDLKGRWSDDGTTLLVLPEVAVDLPALLCRTFAKERMGKLVVALIDGEWGSDLSMALLRRSASE